MNKRLQDELRFEVLVKFAVALETARQEDLKTPLHMQSRADIYTDAIDNIESVLLYDLDEIDNKPWRVFRQLRKLQPDYEETYERYERFFAHGGGKQLEELIEEFEKKEGFTL